MVIILSLCTTIVGAILLERLTCPPSGWAGRSASALLFRLALYTFLYAFFFAWSWRPWSSAWAVLWLVAAFVGVSRAKQAFIHEPLVFSDLSFLGDVFRHPQLFYTAVLGPLIVVGLAASIAISVYICFNLEPHQLPGDGAMIAAVSLAAAWLAVLLVPFVAGPRQWLERWALSIKAYADVDTDLRLEGSLTTLVLDWLCWRGDDRELRISRWRPPRESISARGVTSRPADLIVVAQCESFLDFRRLGSKTLKLPAIDAAYKRATAWGPLVNACPGGYTLRSEFAFLTGASNAHLGFDRYYPYLAAAPYASRALPTILKPFGYESVFIHPYHSEFFNRQVALPALGFDRLIMLDAFENAEKVGDYVADKAVGERVIAEARRAQQRTLLYSATMENHGPWEPGRFQGITEPIAIFEQHLCNGDAMLGKLIAAFDAWPGRVVLVFFGDHVPLLKDFADPFPDSRTDYILLELGRDVQPTPPTAARQLEIHELTWHTLALAGIDVADREGAAVATSRVA